MLTADCSQSDSHQTQTYYIVTAARWREQSKYFRWNENMARFVGRAPNANSTVSSSSSICCASVAICCLFAAIHFVSLQVQDDDGINLLGIMASRAAFWWSRQYRINGTYPWSVISAAVYCFSFCHRRHHQRPTSFRATVLLLLLFSNFVSRLCFSF